MACVLILGASGFLGRHIAAALAAAGHEVIRGVRRPPAGDGARYVAVDYERDHEPADWLPRLERVDAVVNAAGILRERGRSTFEALHVRAPAALFRACAQARVRRVVQVSALGAALLDLALGIAIYLVRRRGWLWRVQIALVLFYTLVITIDLPEYWLHPYGPLTKNLPLLAALVLLHELDGEGR